MSVLSEIVEGLKDKLTGESEKETVIYPCDNCESDCAAYPSACEQCKPYKQKLVDALYNVAHSEEYYARYEIVPEGTETAGVTNCPYCNAPASGTVCEYCGSRIKEGSGKITVKSASEIPNPVIEARNLIYARRKLIDGLLNGTDADGDGGFFDTIASVLSGKSEAEDALGSAMTEPEIEQMAGVYGVSVCDYLEGLDMGTYLSKTAYEKRQAEPAHPAADTAAAAVGAAGIGSAIAGLFNRDDDDNRPAHPASGRPEPPSFNRDERERPGFGNGQNRPERPSGSGFGNGFGNGHGSGHGGMGSGREGGPGGHGNGGRHGR